MKQIKPNWLLGPPWIMLWLDHMQGYPLVFSMEYPCKTFIQNSQYWLKFNAKMWIFYLPSFLLKYEQKEIHFSKKVFLFVLPTIPETTPTLSEDEANYVEVLGPLILLNP